MKMLSILTPMLLSVLAFKAPVVLADYVVAGNLNDSELVTYQWTSVGLVGPPTGATNIGVGQSFVALSSGALATVDALVTRGAISSGSPPLNVSVYTSSTGIPNAKLATLSFSQSAFASLGSQNTRETFDFRQSGVLLENGREYFIAFETPFSVTGVVISPYYVGSSPSSYAESHALSLGTNYATTPNATGWSVQPTYLELGLVVRAAPEPSTLALTVLALAALPVRRRN